MRRYMIAAAVAVVALAAGILPVSAGHCSFAVDSPTDGSATSAASLAISWTTDCSNVNDEVWVYFFDGAFQLVGTFPPASGSTSVDVSALADGAYSVRAGVVDLFTSNWDQFVDVNVTLDKTAPTGSTSQSPAANTNGWNNSNVVVSFSCLDGGSGIATTPANVTLTASGTASGSCVDNAGNSLLLSRTVKIDSGLPLAGVNSDRLVINRNMDDPNSSAFVFDPINSTEMTCPSPSCTPTATGSGATSVEVVAINLMSGSSTPLATSCVMGCSGSQSAFSFSTASLASGLYQLRARATDRAGNLGGYGDPVIALII